MGRTSLTRSCDMWPGHLHQHHLGPCRTTRHSGGGGLSVLPALRAPSFGLRTLHTAARSAGNALMLLLPRSPTQTLHLVNARHSPVFMSDLASPGHTPRPPRPCDISLLHTLTVPGPLHSQHLSHRNSAETNCTTRHLTSDSPLRRKLRETCSTPVSSTASVLGP